MSLLNQFKEQSFLHYISIHEDIFALCISMVWLDGENTLLLVDIQCMAVQEMILCIVYTVIHQCDICTGLDMSLKECIIICCVNHIAWCEDNIFGINLIKAVKVFNICSDICIVDIVLFNRLCKKDIQLSTLGVDVIMTSCSEMFYKGTGFSADIHLHDINTTVTHIGNRKVDHTVSSEERKSSDRTIIQHTTYMYVISCKVNNSKCFTHLTLPPLHVLQPVRYSHCLHCRLRHSFRSLPYRQQVHGLRLHLQPPQRPASGRCQ